MNSQNLLVDTKIFRTARVPAAAIFATMAALLGAVSVVMLFDPSYREYLRQDLISGGITSPDALTTWTVIYRAMAVAGFVCPLILSVGLWMTVSGRQAQGMGMLSSAFQWMARILNVLGIAVLAILIYRVLVYVISCLTLDTGIYLIFTMFVSEAVMVALVWFGFVKLRQFLNDVCDSAASIGYTLSSGSVDSVPIPGFAVTGFLILGILCFALALERMFTVTIVEDYVQSYYKLLVARHPGQIFFALCLAANGCADILCSISLRRYKRTCDRIRYKAHKSVLFRDSQPECPNS